MDQEEEIRQVTLYVRQLILVNIFPGKGFTLTVCRWEGFSLRKNGEIWLAR